MLADLIRLNQINVASLISSRGFILIFRCIFPLPLNLQVLMFMFLDVANCDLANPKTVCHLSLAAVFQKM